MERLVIIGGGAAGMFAACFADTSRYEVILVEKNEKLGKKIYITGKGRCNLSNACEFDDLISHVMTNSRFLYGALRRLDNHKTIELFNEMGLKTKIERGNRVFPESDKASDVTKALEGRLRKNGVRVMLSSSVSKIECTDGMISGVVLQDGTHLDADACIVATGGLSYPTTGSTGDGYRFAKSAGHTIIDQVPSLVSLTAEGDFFSEIAGISLKNVVLGITRGDKVITSDLGEMLFTHKGISGPLALSASAVIGVITEDTFAHIDLKPGLDDRQLDERLLRDFSENINRKLSNSLDRLLPQKLIPVIIMMSGVDGDKKVNAITRQERDRLRTVIKDMKLRITGRGDFKEAVITRGGVNVKEISPKTMESKLVKGLYFAGEVIDVDALTGGYNLQIAWSTGYLAAIGANER